jgi:hypothetical protein
MAARKPFWFEKFYWFLTSENFLVITARDAQQNEILIKKNTKQNDIVFHAHVEGAAFSVVKNPAGKEIPNLTIMETATASLAHSRAWDDKVVVQVFWVHANQVSKSAPSGLYLPTGSFMIYGKKNFVQPFKLEMGYGLIFKVDDENISKHKGEREIREDIDAVPLNRLAAPEIEAQPSAKEEGEGLDGAGGDVSAPKSLLDKIISQLPSDAPTEIQIQKKEKGKKDQAKQKKVDKTKKEEEKKKPKQSKFEKAEEELQEEKQPATVDSKKGKPQKKLTKVQQEKFDKYLENHGDEDEEEQALRRAIYGVKKNYRLEESKRAFVWNVNKTAEDYQAEGGEIVMTGAGEAELEKGGAKKEKEKEEAGKTQGKDKPKGKDDPNAFKDFKKVRKEGLELEPEEEAEAEVEDYANLTGQPFIDDCLLEAYPVCAPYTTLIRYKYKVKLIPGTLKRGKVLKLATDLFCGQPHVYEKERELIKTIPENVSVLQLINNCKLQAQGVNKLVKDLKTQKKKGRKEKEKGADPADKPINKKTAKDKKGK